jgi:hypothetical protein
MGSQQQGGQVNAECHWCCAVRGAFLGLHISDVQKRVLGRKKKLIARCVSWKHARFNLSQLSVCRVQSLFSLGAFCSDFTSLLLVLYRVVSDQ